MKRRQLLRHLKEHGCVVEKEGGEHTWVINTKTKRRSFAPRHTEIKRSTVLEICKQLNIPPPAGR